MLAGISPTYYVFLEQGRNVRPSRKILDALARALHLEPAERALLQELAHGPSTDMEQTQAETLNPVMACVVDQLDPCPAYITGRRWDVLAANRAARLLWTDWHALPPEERNMLWWTFADPKARSVLIEWEAEAVKLLGRFRASAARHSDDPGFDRLVDRLHVISPEVRAWWPRYDLTPLASGVKRLRHSVLGEMQLHHVVLQVVDNQEQKLVVFHPDDEVRAGIATLLGRPSRKPRSQGGFSPNRSPKKSTKARTRRGAS
jgi:hypothetical protein